MTKGVDIKSGSCGMSGHITNALMQFLYCLLPAMWRPVQVVRQYVRSLYRVIRFNPATVCSALALVCFSAVGALAQDGGDTRRPDVRFHNVPSPATHDGMTPFNVSVRFTEPVFEFTGGQSDIFFRLIGLPAGEDKLNYTPTVTNFVKTSSSNNEEIYTFTVTPVSDYNGVRNNIQLDFEIQIPVAAARDIRDNLSWGTGTAQNPHLLMRYAAPNMAPVADAGDPQTVVSGATVTLDGSGSTDDDDIPDTGYTWTRTGGTSTERPSLTSATTAMPTFTADTLASDDTPVTHIFSLVVTDEDDAESTNTSTVTITINPPPADTTPPDGNFETGWPKTHDGSTPFTMAIDFTEPVVFEAKDISFAEARTCTSCLPDGSVDFARDYSPTASNVMVDPNDNTRWTFTVTPKTHTDGISVDFTVSVKRNTFEDLAGNENGFGINHDKASMSVIIRYVAPPPNVPPTANAGPDQTVNSGVMVTLDGSNSTDSDSDDTTLEYAWTREDGTAGGTAAAVTLTGANTAMPTFMAAAVDDASPNDKTYIFTLTVTDDDDDTHTDTVKITINSAPIARIESGKTTPSGESVTLVSTSLDGEDVAGLEYSWARTGGTGDIGKVALNGAATSMLRVLPTDDVATMADAKTHIFTLTVTDAHGATSISMPVTVTVEEPFADPVVIVAGGTTQTKKQGTSVVLDGTGSTKDRRRSIATYSWARTGGTGSSGITLTGRNTAQLSFTADTLSPGVDEVTHIFTLTVTDDGGDSDTETVTVTVQAGPMANAGVDQTVNSGAMVTLDGSGSNGVTLEYAWTRADGTAGGTAAAVTLTGADTAMPTFTAAAVDDASPNDKTYIFTLTVTDEDDDTHTDTVKITINSAPIARIESGKTTPSGEPVTLVSTSLDGEDVAGLEYSWTRTGGTGDVSKVTPTTGETSSTFTITPTDDVATMADAKTHTYTLTVTDAHGASSTSMPVTVTVEEPIADPVVTVAGGTTQTKSQGTSVVLDGTSSTKDRRRSIATYSWARTGGTGSSGITLTGGNTAQLSFTADTLAPGANDVTHIFTLTVTDDGGDFGTGSVIVTVQAGPKADAGDDGTVESGEMYTLDGRRSKVDPLRTLTYAWDSHPQGASELANCPAGSPQLSAVALTDANTAMPSFTAETLTPGSVEAVTYIFQLTVTDTTTNATDTDSVCVTNGLPNASPVAEAGSPQTVDPGVRVQLKGATATDADGNDTIASHVWTRTGGTPNQSVSITNATSLTMAEFDAEPRTLTPGAADVVHIITLTVTDNRGAIGTDTVTITVMAPFAAPVANAGANQTVDSGAMVELDGMGSTFDYRRPISYAWTRTGGTGGAVTLSNADMQKASFTADTLMERDADVTHIFTLTVTDSNREIDTDEVMVTVNAPNLAPMVTITAPDGSPVKLEIASGEAVTLVGSGTDIDGTIRSYAWVRTGGTGQTNLPLTGMNTAELSFMAESLEPGELDVTHIFTLTVTDNDGGTHSATVTVTVTPNARPEARAGPDQTVTSGDTVTLDGSGSTDSGDGSVTGYTWTRTGGTGDNTLVLTGATTQRPTFTADILAPGSSDVTHIFSLVVTDNNGAVSLVADTVTVTIKAATVNIAVSSSELVVQEGGSGTYQVRLSESPGGDVTFKATSGNEDVVRLKTAQLTFTATNWNEWQDVEINTVAESVKKGDEAKVVIRHSLEGVAMGDQPGDVTVTVRAQEDDPIMAPVGQFIATRATALINNQPGLSSFLKLDGPAPGGNFTFQATDGRLSMDGGFIHNGVWGKVSGSRTNSDSGDTDSVLGSFGIHRKYSETFLAGAMLQFALSDHVLAGQTGTIDSTGWLAGPYFAARHGSQPLYFEGRLLYGQSDSDIRFIDRGLGVTRTGSFDSRQVLAQIRVKGEIAVPGRGNGDDTGARDALQLIPYADIRWIEDSAAAFTTDNGGIRVPGQTVNVSQLELGSNMEIPIAVRTGSMTLTGGLGLVYSNTEGDHIKIDARGRGRGELGLSYDLEDNLRLDFDSFYDGIGASDYESYGLSLSAEMKF